MTEIPEHLLARSKKRRQEMTGEAGDAGAPAGDASPTVAEPAVAAASSSAAPVPVEAAPVVVAPPEPVKPWVQAALTRQKIPVWVAPVLVFLPIWLAIYWATLEPATRQVAGPLAVGSQIYSQCSACHGATGGGGIGPQLSEGEVLLTFPDWQSQVAWVINGSPAAGTPYGDPARPGGQRLARTGMPGFGPSLEPAELLSVVMFERVQHGGQSEAELADLQAVIESLDAGEVAIEFVPGQTAADISGLITDLGFDLAAAPAG